MGKVVQLPFRDRCEVQNSRIPNSGILMPTVKCSLFVLVRGNALALLYLDALETQTNRIPLQRQIGEFEGRRRFGVGLSPMWLPIYGCAVSVADEVPA